VNINGGDVLHTVNSKPMPVWANTWHIWTVRIPRRTITGRLVWGRVWRRHDGRRWIYKRFRLIAVD
jgi:hypothetical protein